ncbi:MAG: pyridoxamine 5'-phosphate oxidase family protein [Trebonia sp.]|jgi:hypothetical protein
MLEPAEAAVIATGAGPGTEPLPWAEVRQRFSAERSYWLATTGPGERPQSRPVLAVLLRDKVYSTTSPAAAKGRNLRLRPECALAARGPSFDIVVEGPTSWVGDRHVAEDVAAAYDEKYSWPVTITDEGLFDAPYGAPTAGPPPYRVYGITPRFVYAFGTGDDLGVRSTRFRFAGV